MEFGQYILVHCKQNFGHIEKLYIEQYLSCTEHFMYTGHIIDAPSAVE